MIEHKKPPKEESPAQLRRVLGQYEYDKAKAAREAEVRAESERLENQMKNRGHDFNPWNRRCRLCGQTQERLMNDRTYCQNGMENLQVRGIL